MSTATPKCLAIIACESVVEDCRTHNKSILNVYNVVLARRFPLEHHSMTLFLSLAGGSGEGKLELRLVREDPPGREILFQLEGEVEFPDPPGVMDLTFDLRDVCIPEPGDYSIEAWIDGELVGERGLAAKPLGAKAAPSAGGAEE